MSFKVGNLVRSRKFGSGARKAIALKLADVAKDDGSSIYPSVATIVRETEFCVRLVKRTLADFKRDGILIVIRAGGGRMKATKYRMDLLAVASLPEIKGAPHAPFETSEVEAPATVNGEHSAPFKSERVHHMHLNGAPGAPEPLGTIQYTPSESEAEPARPSIGQASPPGGGAIAPSLGKTIWDEGISLLRPCLPEARYRSLIGKWFKRARTPEKQQKLLAAIRAAGRAGTLDPVPYLEAAINDALPLPPNPATLSGEEWGFRVLAAISRKSWSDDWGPKPGNQKCLVPAAMVTPQLLAAIGERKAA